MLAVFTIILLLNSLIALRVFYLLFFHPLAKYPGPYLPKLTNFWFVIHAAKPFRSIQLSLTQEILIFSQRLATYNR